MKPEIELKFYPIEKDNVRARLESAGFELIHPEFMMRMFAFHHKGESGRGDPFGRVRVEAGGRITMSMKRVAADTIGGTLESQVEVLDFDAACAFMEAASGMQKDSYIERLREIWRRGNVEADIDEWPGLEPLVEIEGETEAAVLEAVRDLGFDVEDARYGAADVLISEKYGIPVSEVNACPKITFDDVPWRK